MELIFVDDFPGGVAQGAWAPFPRFNQDSLVGALDPSSPLPGGGVGLLSNDNAGGFAALSYAVTPPLATFRVETWLRTEVSAAPRPPLNGIAFLVDPDGARFYRLCSGFGSAPALSLAYVGPDSNNYPTYLARWRGGELPGGIPAATGWHRVTIEVVDGRAALFSWDGQALPGGPFVVDRVPAGQVGVYATVAGGSGRAETTVAGFRVYG